MTTVGLPWTASSTRHWSPKLSACCSSHRVDPCKVFSFSAISRQDDYKERDQLDNQGRGGPCWSQGTAAEGRLQFLTALQMKPFSHKQSGNRISLAIFGIVWVCWPVLIDRALVYFVSICSNNVQLITHPSCPQITTTTTRALIHIHIKNDWSQSLTLIWVQIQIINKTELILPVFVIKSRKTIRRLGSHEILKIHGDVFWSCPQYLYFNFILALSVITMTTLGAIPIIKF